MEQAKTPTASESGTLYPELPLDQSYRLQEISRLKKRLEDDRDKRAELYKKYHRGVNALDGIDTALFIACMGMGMGGVGLLSTIIITAPVVLGLEVAALMCGALGMAGKVVSRLLAVKAKKHDQIRLLAESKLNAIAGLVSTALRDGEISDDDFRLVLAEIEKYHQRKDEIRARAWKAYVDEKTSKSLIHQPTRL
jgi:hypothetical protein